MSNASEENRPSGTDTPAVQPDEGTDVDALALPPVTPCPTWCSEGFHPWESDSREFRRFHLSANLASAAAGYILELFQWDEFANGVLEIGHPCVVLDQERVLAQDEAALLVADLAGALR
jgi:hypothetical protein